MKTIKLKSLGIELLPPKNLGEVNYDFDGNVQNFKEYESLLAIKYGSMPKSYSPGKASNLYEVRKSNPDKLFLHVCLSETLDYKLSTFAQGIQESKVLFLLGLEKYIFYVLEDYNVSTDLIAKENMKTILYVAGYYALNRKFKKYQIPFLGYEERNLRRSFMLYDLGKRIN